MRLYVLKEEEKKKVWCKEMGEKNEERVERKNVYENQSCIKRINGIKEDKEINDFRKLRKNGKFERQERNDISWGAK